MNKRQAGDKTEVGTIVSETTALDNRFFTVIEWVVKTLDGVTWDPQLLWDRQGKTFVVAIGITNCNHSDLKNLVPKQLILVRESKYGQMKKILTAATGMVEKNETLLEAAQREFLE
jgi:hypothetical protein